MITLLFGVTFIHLLVTLVMTWKINSWKSKASPSRPSVSIIVAARNELQHLKILIPQLLDQEYPEFEIIVALDRCTDGSLAFLQSVNDKQLRWVVVDEVPSDWNSKKYALNQAIKQSSSEWLLFTDADCIPNSGEWVLHMARETSENTNVLIGVSPYFTKGSFLGHFNQFEAFMTYFLYTAFHLLGRPYMAVGRNLGIRRSYFTAVGGYEKIKGIRGGDDDLFIQNADRSSMALVLGNASLVYTYPAKNLGTYLRQKLRHFSVGNHYASKDLLLLSLYHGTHLCTLLLTLSFYQSSFLLAILLFYLFIKLVSYSFVARKIGAGFNYILFPIVDVLYAFMIPFVSIWSKLVKDIEWRN